MGGEGLGGRGGVRPQGWVESSLGRPSWESLSAVLALQSGMWRGRPGQEWPKEGGRGALLRNQSLGTLRVLGRFGPLVKIRASDLGCVSRPGPWGQFQDALYLPRSGCPCGHPRSPCRGLSGSHYVVPPRAIVGAAGSPGQAGAAGWWDGVMRPPDRT